MLKPLSASLLFCGILQLGFASPAIAGEDSSTTAASQAVLEAAIAAPDRPDYTRKMDGERKPVATLAFLGLQPGMDTADMFPGTGYWTEILANAVGPEGSVTALEPEQFASGEKTMAAWKDLIGRTHGVTLSVYPFEKFTYAPDSFDFVIINLNYHDLYWESEKYQVPRTDPDAFVANLYIATRPGGIVGIIDHVGNPGDTRETVENFHRIDPAVVRADFAKAGFILEEESDLLANPNDDHTTNVFDPAIRGKTDRFMMRFRKPS